MKAPAAASSRFLHSHAFFVVDVCLLENEGLQPTVLVANVFLKLVCRQRTDLVLT